MNAFGFSGWQLALGGVQAGVHNLSIRMKAPFRKVLCDKYKNKFNDESIFMDFSRGMKDIYIWNKFYNHAICGQGLFLHHLLRAYQEQGVPVKLITTTQQIADYLSYHHGYTAMNVDAETTDAIEEKMNAFNKSDINVLSLDNSSLTGWKLSQKKLYLRNMFKKITTIPTRENVMYIVCLLYVDKEEKALLENKENIRLIHFKPETQRKTMDSTAVNIYIPHIDKSDKKSCVEQITSNFPGVSDWIFKKDYFAYHHFVFSNGGKAGFYFMDYKKKGDVTEI